MTNSRREHLLGIVAQGWCGGGNTHKMFDADLAVEIVECLLRDEASRAEADAALLKRVMREVTAPPWQNNDGARQEVSTVPWMDNDGGENKP